MLLGLIQLLANPDAIQWLAVAFSIFAGLVVLLVLANGYLAVKDASSTAIAGCRRIGLVDSSNMSDQYDAAHNGKDGGSDCRVKAVFIYPIKSCGIIELSETDVVATGLRYDRQFCFAQLHTEEDTEEADGNPGNDTESQPSHTWKFITQRKIAKLSQIRTEIWLPDPSSPGYSLDLEWVQNGGCLVCNFPFKPVWEWTNIFRPRTTRDIWSIVRARLLSLDLQAEPMMNFKIPLFPDAARCAKYPREVMQIWKDSPEAINVSAEISPEVLARLKHFLGLSNPLGLFMADPKKRRDIFRNAPSMEEAGYQPGTGFADAYPLSIMGLASVQDVAKTIHERKQFDLSALRFRANIYITGVPPYTEDTWKMIRIGQLRYHVSCRTTRCELPNVDPDTGARDKQEPMRTMKRIRAFVDKGAGANPCLGMQMVPLLKEETGSERLAVGDRVEVLSTGEHYYIRMFQPGEQVLST